MLDDPGALCEEYEAWTVECLLAQGDETWPTTENDCV